MRAHAVKTMTEYMKKRFIVGTKVNPAKDDRCNTCKLEKCDGHQNPFKRDPFKGDNGSQTS